MNRILKNRKKIFLILIPLFLSFPNLVMGGFIEDICASCGVNPFCWITCPITWLFTLVFRLPVLFFALLGFLLALLFIGIGWLIVPPITDTLIGFSLKTDIFNIEALSSAWGSIRGFALGLVTLFLLLIGLLTIFRIAEYQARKTLVSLLIAALLVSFSLPIGKEIIDIGNKLTIYVGGLFGVSGLGTGGETEIKVLEQTPKIGEIYQKLFEALTSPDQLKVIYTILTANGDLLHFIQVSLLIIVLAALSYWIFAVIALYVSIVLFALGIVFLLRYLFLVCLLIVSPIAFLTAGLRTREIKQIFGGFLNWDGWWPAFLEWVFVGVILMIWLGVGTLILKNLPAQSFSVPDYCTAENIVKDVAIARDCEAAIAANQLLSFLPVLAFAVAIHIGVKTSPGIIKQAVEGVIGVATLAATAAAVAGTAAITGGASAFAAARAKGVSLGGALRTGLTKGVREGTKTFRGRLAAGLPGAMEKALPEEFRPGYEALVKAPAEEVTRRVPWVKRKITAPLIYEREEAEKAVEEIYKKEGAKGVLKTAEDPFATREMRIESILKAMREGFDKGEEWMRNKAMRELTLGIYEEAAKKGDKKTMGMMERRVVKSLAEDSELQEGFKKIAVKHKMYDEAKEGPYIERILKGVKSADDVKQLQKGWYKNVELLSTAIEHEYLRGPQLRALGEDREFVEIYSRSIQNLIDRIRIDEFIRKYPRQAMYLAGNAAQELGYTAPPGLTRERIRELKRRWEEEERRRREEEERIGIAMRRMFGRSRGS
jgi:hypothetical protein